MSDVLTPLSPPWKDLFEVLVDGVALVDELGVIRYANERLAVMSGYEPDRLVGLTFDSLVAPRRHADHGVRLDEFAGKSIAPKKQAGSDLDLLRRDGSKLASDVTVSTMLIDGKQWAAALIRDDEVQRNAEHPPAPSDLHFRLAFEANMAPIIFTDLENQAIAVNDAFCNMIGFDRSEILGFDSKRFTHPDDVDITEESHRFVATGAAGQTQYVKRYLHKDGRVIIVEVSRSSARDSAGNILYFVISQRDITELVQRNRLLQLLGRVNRLATFATNEAEFLQQICDALVNEGGYSLAWIAITSNTTEGDVDVMCASGATDYLEGATAGWWGSKDSELGPTAISLRTGLSQVVNDLAHHQGSGVWGERATQFGFGSMLAIPDRIGDRRAALIIYHRDLFAFDDITVSGLEEIVREAELAVVHVRANREVAESLEKTIVANANLRRSEQALSVSEQRFRLSFESNMAPMIFSDHDDLAIAVNDAFCEMVGFTREELLGHDSKHFTYPADVGITEATHIRLVNDEISQTRYVKRYLRKDGRVVISEVSRSAARDEAGKTLYFFSSERDITQEHALADQLSHLALHHPLTGLANRALFEDRLSQAHARLVRDGGWGAVIMLNLDDFKGVNDTLGYLAADELLIGVARRLELATRPSDTLCHLGGDEFLYLVEGLKSVAEAEEIARRLLEILAPPFSFAKIDLEQHASLGIVVYDATSADSTELVQNANAALREAKNLNRGNFTLFAGGMHERAVSRFSLVQELRQALEMGDLAMHYQPIVDLTSTAVVGFEALMRWRHPQRGMVPPDVFIPLAEQSHLIVELGSFALREAVAAAKSWDRIDTEATAPYVTVNISAHQFHHKDLVGTIEEVLLTSGLSPTRLILEITESVALIDVAETLDVIEKLHRLGVGIALDDFGTGYCSLSYLTLLQPRIIKIDKSFISSSHENPQNNALLEAIVSLGMKLKMIMLAEGIETAAQLEQLRHLSCELGQGYLFSPAVPIGETAAMVHGTFASGG